MKKGYTHITLVLDSSGSMGSIKKDTIGGYNEFIKKQKEVPGECSYKHVEFSSANKQHRKNARATKYLVPFLAAPAVIPADTPYSPKYPSFGQLSVNASSQMIWNNSAAIPVQGGNCAPNWSGQSVVSIPSVWTNPGFGTNDQYSEVESLKDIRNASLLNDETYLPGGGTPLLDSIGRAIYETGEYLAALAEADRPEKVLVVILTDGEENQSREYTKDDIQKYVKHQTDVYQWDFIFLGANMDAIQTGSAYGFGHGTSVNFAATAAGMSGTTHTLSEKVATYRTTQDFMMAKSSLNYSVADRTASMGGDVAVDSNTTNQVSVSA